MDSWVETQTQVPWCAGGRAFRFFKACDFSLKSDGFCCEMSISALATMSPKEGEEKKDKKRYITYKVSNQYIRCVDVFKSPFTLDCNHISSSDVKCKRRYP